MRGLGGKFVYKRERERKGKKRDSGMKRLSSSREREGKRKTQKKRGMKSERGKFLRVVKDFNRSIPILLLPTNFLKLKNVSGRHSFFNKIS